MASTTYGSARKDGAPATLPKRAVFNFLPERVAFGHSLRSSLPAQYWGVPLATAASPDGLLPSSPSEPAPLPLAMHTGTSRPQLILAAQAAKVPGYPPIVGLPSYCHDQGGVVLDRVLLRTGGERWWGMLLGRLKAQSLWRRRSDLGTALSDPSMYSLCATSKVSVGSKTVLRARADWQPPLSNGGGGAGQQAAGAASATAAAAQLSASLRVRSRVSRAAETAAELSINQRSISSSASGPQQAYHVTTPLVLALESGTPANVPEPLAWRVGLLQVTAPPTAPGSAGGSESAKADGAPALRSAVYVQGSIALQGERALWRAPRVALKRTSSSQQHSTAAGPAHSSAVVSAAPSATAPAAGTAAPAAPVAAAAAHRTQQQQQQQAAGRATEFSSASSSSSEEVSGSSASGTGSGDEDTDPTDGAAGNWTAQHRRSRHHHHHHHHLGPLPSASSASSRSSPFGISLPDPGQIQEDLSLVTQRMSRLRDSVTQAERRVAEEGLAGICQPKRPGAGGQAGKQQHSAPWSAFVPQPHLKVAGIVGLTARSPLLRVAHGSADGASAALASSLGQSRVEWLQDFGLPRLRGGNGGTASAAQRQEAVRPFASGAVSFQAGRFTRTVLDFTQLAAKLDLGLWGPALKGQPQAGSSAGAAAGGGARHPAFALDDRGAWHALTISACQQLLGPIRLCADWRYELASSHLLALAPLPRRLRPSHQAQQQPGAGIGGQEPSAAGGILGAGTWAGQAGKEVARHVSGMRPCLLDAVYAVDVAVPGSSGAARLVAWYAPQRREGMLELRLF